jgi:DNA-binding transcriptional LysR family regulator
MNYTLSQLNVFVKVVEYQSVTRASEYLHMTQPAVSIQLKNFQDQFEIPLFEVISRRIHITAFGKEVAESAKEILFQADLLKHKALQFKGALTGTLKLSVVSTGKYVIPFYLKPFLDANPGVDLQMDVTNKELVVESLGRNEIDFALVSILPERLSVDSINLLDNSLYLIGDHTFSNNRKLAVSDLAKYPLILREQGSGTRQQMEQFLKKNKLSKKENKNEAVKQAVKAGLGLSIMPVIGLKHEMEAGELKILKIKGLPVHTAWQLISLKGKRHGPVAEAFRTYIMAHKTEIAEQHFNWLQ